MSSAKIRDHGHGHNHSHAPRSLGALVGVLALTSVIFLAELIAGFLSRSLALLSDAMHMLSDSTGLVLALVAMLIARRGRTQKATYGYRRIEVLAAAINAVAVAGVSIYIVVDAVRRLGVNPQIDVPMMMTVATIGLVANGISAVLLVRHQGESLNMRGAYLHVLTDLFGSIAVIVAGTIIWFTGFAFADTIASFVIAALVLPRSLGLLGRSMSVLLERAPASIDVGEVARVLGNLDGVLAVHDLHVWSTNGTDALCTCHLVIAPGLPADCGILDQAQAVLAELGITHATVQIEEPGHSGHEEVC